MIYVINIKNTKLGLKNMRVEDSEFNSNNSVKFTSLEMDKYNKVKDLGERYGASDINALIVHTAQDVLGL
jgi:hypothetical protein